MLYEKIHDMEVIVRPQQKTTQSTSYAGGQLPLVPPRKRDTCSITKSKKWQNLPNQIQDWLQLQQTYSTLPEPKSLLLRNSLLGLL